MKEKEAMDYLESLAGFGIKPGLERIKELLTELGQPQLNYKMIHVTGTNGKGSVCAMLSEILKYAGIKVGLFTSPHLVRYEERIRVNGEEIAARDFASLVEEMRELITKIKISGHESPTLFETLTAMAFKHFADEQVEYAVIEVGLGGLLDSTNVIRPEVSIITNVANDHAEKCGGSLLGIARHKAGIIKPFIPVVTGAKGEALQIIREVANDKHSKLFVLDEDFHFNDTIKISLQGEYQKSNAAIVIKAAHLLNDERITNSVINDALNITQWPGRFEIFNIDSKCIIIDGAHNGAGAKALRESLDKRFEHEKRTYLFGVLKDKDIDTILDNLFRSEDYVIVTKPDSERAAALEDICQRLKSRGIKVIAIENNTAAFNKFISTRNSLLIATGSLYLIGYIRELLKKTYE